MASRSSRRCPNAVTVARPKRGSASLSPNPTRGGPCRRSLHGMNAAPSTARYSL